MASSQVPGTFPVFVNDRPMKVARFLVCVCQAFSLHLWASSHLPDHIGSSRRLAEQRPCPCAGVGNSNSICLNLRYEKELKGGLGCVAWEVSHYLGLPWLPSYPTSFDSSAELGEPLIACLHNEPTAWNQEACGWFSPLPSELQAPVCPASHKVNNCCG